MSKYTVIQAVASFEKNLVAGRSPEGDLAAKGHVVCKENARLKAFECEPYTLRSSAWCPDTTGATSGELPTCDGGLAGDVVACERKHDAKDTRKTGRADWVTSCLGDGVPTCATSGEEPACLAENALDRRASAAGNYWPVGRDGSDWMTVSFTVGVNVEFMEVTRIDLREYNPNDGAPDSVGIEVWPRSLCQ